MSANAPRLRTDLAIVEQVFREEKSFVVKDPTTHAYFRFRPVEMQVMRLFDGARSAADVTDAMIADGVRVSLSTVEGFVRKLSKLGLLERTLLERTTMQLERLRSERRRQRSLFRGELFRLRFSFGDPDRKLTRLYPLVRWCFTPAFVLVSVLLFSVYLGVSASHGKVFAADVAATFAPAVLTPWTVLLLLLTLAALTFVHEMGHAFACKHFGGEVHEMGFMLIFFMPAFYANVNDAWSFQSRSHRLWVTAAGGWIELFLTSLMAIVWVTAAPGALAGQVALAAMLIGGMANLLTNANPLLPLDGYFALGDWLEVPNLRLRAKSYVSEWFRRKLLRVDLPESVTDPHERRILLAYGAAAAIYSTTFLLIIASKVITPVYRTLGALAAMLIVGAVLFAMRRGMAMVVSSLRLLVHSRNQRRWWRRKRATVAVLAGLALIAAALIPCNLTTSGTFTVMPRASLAVTAPATGVISSVFVREGDQVAVGSPLLRLTDFALDRERVTLARITDSLSSGARQARALQQTGYSDALTAESDAAEARSTVARVRSGELRIRAGIGGVVATPHPERLLGQRVRFGDTLVLLAELSHVEAVIRVRGAGTAGVHEGQRVRLLSYQDTSHPLDAVVQSVSPVANDAGVIEARASLLPGIAARVGATGDARILWRRSTLLGALVWAIRSRVRSDLLL